MNTTYTAWEGRKCIKNKHGYAIPVIVLCILLTSCQKEVDMADSNAVSFTSTIGTAKASGTTWDANDQIGVFMYPAGGATASSANVPYTTATGNGNFAPSGSTSLYYPVNGNADFYAYYPYQQGMSGTIYKVNVAVQTNPKAIDLLRAVKANVAKSKSAQSLLFSHQLARLTLTISAGTGVTNADLDDLSGVTIGSVSTTADFDVKTGLLTNPGNEQSVSLNLPADKRSGSALLIPGNIAGKKLSFSFGGSGTLAGKTFSYTFPNGTMLLSGKQHSYAISVNPTAVSVSSSGITNWGSVAPVISEGSYYSFQVGDFYPYPNSASSAIGVVFWVDPDNSGHGKIISLDETEELKWSYTSTFTNATSRNDGKLNMDRIKALSPDFTGYPPFKWCADKTAGGLSWYFPAIDELSGFINLRNRLNESLSHVPSSAQISTNEHWSSTDRDQGTCNAYWKFGEFIAWKSKSGYKLRVRAIATF